MGLLPGKLKRRDRVGIDVGRRAVKAVHCAGGTIVASRLVPWEAPDHYDEDATSRLTDAVRRAVSTFGLRRSAPVNVAMSLSFGTLRTFEFPPASEEEWREMAKQEFSIDAGTGADEIEVAVWSPPSQSGLQSVCAWALPVRVSRYVVSELSRAGVRCAVIDSLPHAQARAVASVAGGGGPTAIVDWGAYEPSLTVVLHGRPVFTRMLRDCGHARIVERLGEGLGLTTNEAWEFFDGFGPHRDSSPEMHQLLVQYAGEAAGHLVNEIERTLDFLGARGSGLAPESILLVGGGAELVCDALREAFGTRVETWSERCGVTVTSTGSPSAHGAAVSLAQLEVSA